MKRSRLYHVYDKIQRRVVPGLRYSQDFYEDRLREVLSQNAWWLDIGCGHQVLPAWREQQEKSLVQQAEFVVGFDYDWPSLMKHRSIHLRVQGKISALSFKDESFDLVTANMVVEHLAEPDLQFREIHRILRPGGLFVFHTPNAYGYMTLFARLVPEFMKGRLIQLLDGRAAEDVFKTYYRANTESQIRRLAQQTGFEIEKLRLVASVAKFAVIAPLAFFELLWIRLLLWRGLRSLRTNLIVTLKKCSR
jgi:SAM-dependent methyltransferase